MRVSEPARFDPDTSSPSTMSAQTYDRLIGVSLKMYKSPPETLAYVRSLLPHADLANALQVTLFVCPDFLSLAQSSTLLSPTPILLGAQDCCDEDEGAFTGEVSPKHLAELGVALVVVGHAERRALYGETDEWIARKAAAAVRNGLVPVACIGEKQEGSAAIAIDEIRPQLLSVLSAIPSTADVIFAYEPVWAIGKDTPASAAHVVAVSKALRTIAEEGGRSGKVSILYGGSAGPGTFEKLEDGLDGLLLGRFGHDVKKLEACLREVGIRR